MGWTTEQTSGQRYGTGSAPRRLDVLVNFACGHSPASPNFARRCLFGGEGALGRVADDVRQGGLGDLAREVRGLAGQSRKLERKPCAVTSSFSRRNNMSKLMLLSERPRRRPGKM